MHEMTRDEWWEFASAGTRTGMLAVVRADGAPHVTPVWFLLNDTPEGAELIFTTEKNSLKGKAFRRDPRLSLSVDNQRAPYSFVQFTAEATLHSYAEDDLGELLGWATAIGARYMGADRAESYGQRNAVVDEYLVRAKVTKVIGTAEISD